jgi:hypothetical protein
MSATTSQARNGQPEPIITSGLHSSRQEGKDEGGAEESGGKDEGREGVWVNLTSRRVTKDAVVELRQHNAWDVSVCERGRVTSSLRL